MEEAVRSLEKMWQESPKKDEKLNKMQKEDDILHIAKQFVCYFEEVDRSEVRDNSIKSS